MNGYDRVMDLVSSIKYDATVQGIAWDKNLGRRVGIETLNFNESNGLQVSLHATIFECGQRENRWARSKTIVGIEVCIA